jgi:hypothetical protein
MSGLMCVRSVFILALALAAPKPAEAAPVVYSGTLPFCYLAPGSLAATCSYETLAACQAVVAVTGGFCTAPGVPWVYSPAVFPPVVPAPIVRPPFRPPIRHRGPKHHPASSAFS